MNTFWMTFLCLLIGGMVGYEIGKWMEHRRLRIFMENIEKSIKTAVEQKKTDEENRKFNFAKLVQDMEKATKDLQELKEKRARMLQEEAEKQKEQIKE